MANMIFYLLEDARVRSKPVLQLAAPRAHSLPENSGSDPSTDTLSSKKLRPFQTGGFHESEPPRQTPIYYDSDSRDSHEIPIIPEPKKYVLLGPR